MDLAYLQVVRICNQKCIFCAQPSTGKIESLKNIQERIDAYKAQWFGGVILNGGEPTLHKEIAGIIAYVREQGMYPRMISNGINFSEKSLVEECISAGLKQINISFHSYIPEVENSLMRGNVYKKQLKWLLHMLEKRQKIDIWVNIVLNRYTVNHIDKTVLFFLKLWVSNFVINNLEVTWVYPEYLEKLLFRLSECRETLPRALSYIKQYNGKARVSRIPLCYMRGFEEFSRDNEYYIFHEKKYIHYLTNEKNSEQVDFISDETNWQDPTIDLPGAKRNARTESCSSCDLRSLCSWYDLLEYFPWENPLIPQKVDNRAMEDILEKILWKK